MNGPCAKGLHAEDNSMGVAEQVPMRQHSDGQNRLAVQQGFKGHQSGARQPSGRYCHILKAEEKLKGRWAVRLKKKSCLY